MQNIVEATTNMEKLALTEAEHDAISLAVIDREKLDAKQELLVEGVLAKAKDAGIINPKLEDIALNMYRAKPTRT